MGYLEYCYFIFVLMCVKEVCENSGYIIDDYFEEIFDMVKIGLNVKRVLKDIVFFCYVCYLVV